MDRDILAVRWTTFAGLLAAAALYLFPFASANPNRLAVLVPLILVAAGLLTAGVESWLRYVVRRAGAPQAPAHEPRRTGLLLDFHRRLLEANAPQAVVEAALRVGCDLLAARGASFVPFDEWGGTIPALVHGRVPDDALHTWSKRLSAPEVRQTCKGCRAAGLADQCILLDGTERPGLVQCARVGEADREVGVMNFYFDAVPASDPADHLALAQVSRSTAAALDSLRLRDREIAALQYLQDEAVARNDVLGLLDNLLDNLQKAMDVDLAVLWTPEPVQLQARAAPVLLGRFREGIEGGPLPDGPFLQGLWQSLANSRGPLTLENVIVNTARWRVLLALPLAWREQQPLGILVLANRSDRVFTPRQLMLLQTVAGEAALLLENARLMVKVEFQAVVDERTRLAREIHDGLAQTLAFLKIQSAQMQTYLEQGRIDRLTDTLQASSRTLNDAYLDARQAIDNLRQVPHPDLLDWLAELTADFESQTGIAVDTSAISLARAFSPTVQAQLIRILQEALSNIRKHAGARHVAIAAWDGDGEAVIEVRDDGEGFNPESVSEAARYGLRGMHERAEMLGADFQIVSRPGQGTVLRLGIPSGTPEGR